MRVPCADGGGNSLAPHFAASTLSRVSHPQHAGFPPAGQEHCAHTRVWADVQERRQRSGERALGKTFGSIQ